MRKSVGCSIAVAAFLMISGEASGDTLRRTYPIMKDVADIASYLQRLPAWKECSTLPEKSTFSEDVHEELLAFLNETGIHGMGDDKLSKDYYAEIATGAELKRHALPWASEAPWDIYRGYAVAEFLFDEPRQAFRDTLFAAAIRLMIKHDFFNKNPCANAETVARFLHGHMMKEAFGKELKFIPDSTPEYMAPRDIIQHGGASCTGHSILVVAMLRSVGIPCRVAGTPLWNSKDGGNHSWLEVYVSGKWMWADAFIDSPKQDAWNQAWFFPAYVKKQIPNDKLKSIYATTYWPTKRFPAIKGEEDYIAEDFPLEWHEDFNGVKGLKRTKWYQAQIKDDSEALDVEASQ